MSCTPLFPKDGEFFWADQAIWHTGYSNADGVEITWRAQIGNNPAEIEVTVSGDTIRTLTHQALLNHDLSYKFFPAPGYVLILDSDRQGTYQVSRINYRQQSLQEWLVRTFSASSVPAVQTNLGNGAVFLLLAPSSAQQCAVLGFYRGDNGERLFSSDPLIPAYQSGLQNIRATIHNVDSQERYIVISGGASSVEIGSIPSGRLDVLPDAITDFSALVDGSVTRSFTFENTGNDCLIIDEIESASGFSAGMGAGGLALPAGQQMTVNIMFQPDHAGIYEADLAITRIPAMGDETLTCRGEGREPVTRIGFEPETLSQNFGQVGFGSTVSRDIRIKNTGDIAIDVSTDAPPPGSPFQWAAWSGRLNSQQHQDLSVAFTPSALAGATGSMQITSSAPGSPHTMQLSGTGVQSVVHDLFLRDNLGDDGTEPLQGGISLSPDIILRNEQLLDPEGFLGSPEALNSDRLGQNAEAGQDNYIYLRVHNKGTSPSSGTARVYWSRPSTLPSPTSWEMIDTIGIPSVSPGSVAVVGPVVWASDAMPGLGHYCFVGVIDTEGEPPVNLAAIRTWMDFDNLIRSSNNVTWRNFDVVDLIQGATVTEKFDIRGWPRVALHSDLKLDLSEVPRSARVYLRVNRRMAMPARTENLQVVAERQDHRVYRAEPGRVCSLFSIPLQPSDSSTAALELTIPERVMPFRLHVVQEIEGREMGRITRLMAMGQHKYVGNKETHELHQRDCTWAQAMLPRHQVPYREIEHALHQGYNGCHYCLPAYDAR
jgi:Abnormal spindle-like microcephaly-assoc'd, ASPM-SPD-2-Hydin